MTSIQQHIARPVAVSAILYDGTPETCRTIHQAFGLTHAPNQDQCGLPITFTDERATATSNPVDLTVGDYLLREGTQPWHRMDSDTFQNRYAPAAPPQTSVEASEPPTQAPVVALVTLQSGHARRDALDTIHLVRATRSGTPGPTLCGIERFGPGSLGGWDLGGGSTGPGYTHTPCPGCGTVADNDYPDLPISEGMFAALFGRPIARAGHGWP